jgi:hypothetical protein
MARAPRAAIPAIPMGPIVAAAPATTEVLALAVEARLDMAADAAVAEAAPAEQPAAVGWIRSQKILLNIGLAKA